MLRLNRVFRLSGRARARRSTPLPAATSVDKKEQVVKPEAPGKADTPREPPVMPPPTRSSPFLPLAATSSRRAIAPPKSLVDGIMTILKGRDTATISAHFADMEESLDSRDRGMVKAMLAKGKSTFVTHNDSMTTSPPLLYGPKETLAFVQHRMLPLYSVEVAVLSEVAAALPSFEPKSMLDFGSGKHLAHKL